MTPRDVIMAVKRRIRLQEKKHEPSTIKLMHSGLISFPPPALMEGGLLVDEDESERHKLPSGLRLRSTGGCVASNSMDVRTSTPINQLSTSLLLLRFESLISSV